MGKFVYRFESIMNVKEILEKKIQEEISLINKEINELKNQLAAIIDERKKVQQKMSELSLKAAEFQSVKMYDSLLEKKILSVERKINQLLKKKEEKQKELIERKKEHKVFETLKENQREEFLLDEKRNELKELNEIAIRNYGGNQK
ncbi:MAG: flagellar export protein FliJ [Bacteroidota bacterium]